MGVSRFVNAVLPVVPFERDVDAPEVFLGPEIRVGEEFDGAPVTLRFGGHRDLDGSAASCVIQVFSAGREVLCLTLPSADRMAVELVRQAARGGIVADPPVVTVGLDDCVEPQCFDPANPDDVSTVMSWPALGSKARKQVA